MVKLYTTHCPNCRALETKLQSKEIEFEEITDQSLMVEKQIRSVPVLEVDGRLLTFYEAVKWVDER
jgi:glutaredoxin